MENIDRDMIQMAMAYMVYTHSDKTHSNTLEWCTNQCTRGYIYPRTRHMHFLTYVEVQPFVTLRVFKYENKRKGRDPRSDVPRSVLG